MFCSIQLLNIFKNIKSQQRRDRTVSLLDRRFSPVISECRTNSVDIAVEEQQEAGTGPDLLPNRFIDGSRIAVWPRLRVLTLGQVGVMYRRPLQCVVRNLLNVSAARAAHGKVKTSWLTLALPANGIEAKLSNTQVWKHN